MDKNRSLDIIESCIKMLKDMSEEEFAQSLADKNLIEYEDSYYVGDNFKMFDSSTSGTAILSTQVNNFMCSFGVNKPNFYGMYEGVGEQVYVFAA